MNTTPQPNAQAQPSLDNEHKALPDLKTGMIDRLMARRQSLQMELSGVDQEIAASSIFNRPTPN